MPEAPVARLTALIVDDEPLSRRAMRQLLDMRDDVSVLHEYPSVAACLADARPADVLFLDIEMPGQSGLALLSTLTGPTSPAVIVVTAHDEYAVSAFDTVAVDYLTKPVAPARLHRALERVYHSRAARRTARHTAVAPTTIAVRVGPNDVFLPLDAVTAIEADGVYAAIHANNRRYLHRRSLDALSDELGACGFLRLHRSWLVPIRAIVGTRRQGPEQRAAVLETGKVVPISRRRLRAVTAALRGRQALTD